MGNSINSPNLDVPGLLKEHNLKPEKSLGQNFLIDPHYLSLVANAGNIHREETVLEIGAGLGNLTRLVAQQAQRVYAVEVDPNFIPILQKVTSRYQSVKIIEGDILKINLEALSFSKGFLVIGNIPYYITSNLLRHLTSGERKPGRIVLTIQKEVAERILARTGKLSLLALSVQVYGSPTLISNVPAGAFYPVPKVDSAIIRIDLFSSPLIAENQRDVFFRLAKAGFSQKRKKLRNSLSAGLNIDKESTETLLKTSNIDFNRRAETLSLDEWIELTSEFTRLISPQH